MKYSITIMLLLATAAQGQVLYPNPNTPASRILVDSPFIVFKDTINGYYATFSIQPPKAVTIPSDHSAKHIPQWVMHGSLVTAGLVAGVADGQREVIVHNKWDYRRKHPNANENWWNPDSTWKRADGNSFLGGTLFVAPKDKYHMNGFIRTTMFSIQMGTIVMLVLDDLRRGKKVNGWKVALYVVEAQGSYMFGKGATHWWYKQ